jgi:murein DD-endopeptidase MepM/ murein hydrolase activator NlpD
VGRTSTALGELIVEDPDDPDAEDEDGGVLAPVDANLAASAAKPSFWQSLARGVKGLVVRKADSKPASLPPDELAHLFAAEFPLPLAHFSREKLRDSFNASRGRHRRHHAIDLPAVRGTPVLAVVDGYVERMGRDRRGGKVIYLRDTSNRYTFYYAHLSKHEPDIRPGDRVTRGQKLGEVGSTGRVFGGPHLHFAIFRTPENETSTPWRGLVVNPYLVFVSRVR